MFDDRPSQEPPTFHDQPVVDPLGRQIGVVTDVIYDELTGEPVWATVDLGRLLAKHYVPVEGAYVSGEGQVVVPYDKRTVRHALKAGRGHQLSASDGAALRRHYGLA